MAEKPKLPPGVSEAFLELMEDWVQFCPALARLCGSAAAGLMLSKAVSWSRTREVIARGGWFWKTADEWTAETCLSRREQQTAREIIRGMGFWEEAKKKIDGAPTMHFRVDFTAILAAHLGEVQAKMEMAETPNQASEGNGENAKSIEKPKTPNQNPDLAKKEFHKSAKSYKEAKTHTKTPSDTSGHNGGRLSRSERDTWDLRRWKKAMEASAPQVGEYIADREAHWRQRARDAAFAAGLSPDRIVELLKQHFPDDANVDLLYQPEPELFAQEKPA